MTGQTLIELILRRLDRPTDSATVALYRERLLGYLNEAILDLTASLRPWRRDVLPVIGGQAYLSSLPRTCLKVLTARVNGVRWLFYYGSSQESIVFPGIDNGIVEITYRYQPALLEGLTDEVQLPEEVQELLVEYAAARERSRFDAASQNAARLELALYRELKGELGRTQPPAEPSRFYHLY
jgi:hypothetical protein